MTEWRQFKLKDILEPDGYIRGPFGSSLRRGELKNEGIPVYEQEHAIKGIRKFRYYIDQNKFNELKRFCVKTGDIIISCSGTVGEVSVIKEEDPKGIISQALLILRADKNVAYQPFLKYFLMSPYGKSSITSRSDGSVQVNIAKRQVIENIDILLPPLPEQKAIAEVLSSLDDKIDLLTRQNKTLEDIAQAYFRKWFIEDASDKWEEKGLDEIADFLNGLPLQKYPYKTGNPLHVIKIKELNNGFTDSSDLCSADIPEQYIVHPGDVIFSWSGSLKVDIWKYGKGALNQHLFKVTSCNYPKWFYYFWIKYHLPEFKMIAESKATTMGHIQRRDLSNAIVLVPENQEINNMDNIMSPLIKKIEQNNAQILVLQKLRDTLLPKLISSEIRLKM
jgi:type I restriction enzyme S subunit